MTEPTREQIIEEYIKRCEDRTGTLRRYWGYLKSKMTWTERWVINAK